VSDVVREGSEDAEVEARAHAGLTSHVLIIGDTTWNVVIDRCCVKLLAYQLLKVITLGVLEEVTHFVGGNESKEASDSYGDSHLI